jgi:hypothetical protein
MEYGTFLLDAHPFFGDGMLHVVRLQPGKVALRGLLASENEGRPHTASDWVDRGKVWVGINAGMYAEDHRSNVGFLQDGAHHNQPVWKASYESLLVMGPKAPGLPPWQLVDLDVDPQNRRLADSYAFALQNLRLIRSDEASKKGRSVWGPNRRAWSESAVAIDREGRLLLLFSRSPLTMSEFNERVLRLPLDVLRAMHVEGGPEASLSIHAPGLTLDLCGSYETGFMADDSNRQQWEIPNVLGARPLTP